MTVSTIMFKNLARNSFVDTAATVRRLFSTAGPSSASSSARSRPQTFDFANTPYQYVYPRIHDSDGLDTLARQGHRFTLGARVRADKEKGPQKYQNGPPRIGQMTGDTVHLVDNIGSLMARMQLVSMNSPEITSRRTAFSGTGFAEQYLAEVGLLPTGSKLNELDPLRSINLDYTIHHAEEVASAVDRFSLEIRQILYNVKNQRHPFTQAVDLQVLEQWEPEARFGATEHEQMKQAVHDHLMARLATHWDPETGPRPHAEVAAIYKILQRNARDSHPIRVIPVEAGRTSASAGRANRAGGSGANLGIGAGGSTVRLHVPDRNFILSMVGESRKGSGLLKEGKGINFTRSVLERVSRDTREIGSKLAGRVEVQKSDGFEFWSQARFGSSVYGDPPYLPMVQRNKPQDGMNYVAGPREEYLYENWERELLDKIEIPWDSNVPMLQQNRYVDKLRNLLEYHGWWVSEPVFPVRNRETATMELLASNFNEVDGAPAIRKRGYASAVARMAFQNNDHDSKRLTAKCQLGKGDGEPAWLEGVVIDGWMYAEVEGKMTRFGGSDGLPVLPDPNGKPGQRAKPNGYALKIRETQWVPARLQDVQNFPRQAPEFKPKLPKSASRASPALALQFRSDTAALRKQTAVPDVERTL